MKCFIQERANEFNEYTDLTQMHSYITSVQIVQTRLSEAYEKARFVRFLYTKDFIINTSDFMYDNTNQ